MNENQNIYVRDGRSTSRVLNRPGGTCQISLGGYTEAELERMKKLREEREAAKKTGVENEKKAVTNERPCSGPAETNDPPPPSLEKTASVADGATKEGPSGASVPPSAQRTTRISSNAFASSSTTNSFNVLTDRPTSKVSNPPGGRTSFTLG